MNKSILLLTGIVALMATSCRTTWQSAYLPIDIMIPATIDIPQNVKNVGIIYRNSIRIKDIAPYAFYFSHSDQPTAIYRDNPVAYLYVETLLSTLSESDRFENIDLLPEHNDGLSDENWLYKVNLDSLNKEYIIKYPETDLFLVADVIATECIPVLVRELGFIYVLNITTQFWEIINARENKTFLYHKSDTLIHEKTFYAPEGRTQFKVPSEEWFNLESASESAAKFGKKLIPHWITADRVIYRSGHYEMRRAWQLIKSNQWNAAAAILEEQTRNKNRNIAAKAMFNLALAREIAGDLEEAMNWTIKSYYVFQEEDPQHANNTKEYINILAKRKKDVESLDKQLHNAGI